MHGDLVLSIQLTVKFIIHYQLILLIFLKLKCWPLKYKANGFLKLNLIINFLIHNVIILRNN